MNWKDNDEKMLFVDIKLILCFFMPHTNHNINSYRQLS